ncbi:MAG: helicase-exonuclease AddAB subunit AddA [Oscillospiraceae bacterium]|nr:helicase-exonuclease AddAB subunit AddA [Oscillospiraceae bacterium]
MSKWTDEQKAAIDARGCSLIVSAAAGSGKTSVLVERLMQIIKDSENQTPVEKMIVVTFTKDAAAEMKQRLSASLSRLIEENPQDSWLARQNSMLGCAAISTITSFCLDLLRNNISQLSFSSAFRVADETEEAVLKTEAYQNTSDYFYSERYDDMILLRNNFCGTSDISLENMIYDLYNCVSSVPFFELWLDGAAEKYDSGIYEETYAQFIESDVKACKSAFEKAESAVLKLGNEKVSELVNTERCSFMSALERFEQKDFCGFADILSGISFPKFPPPKKTDDRDIREIVLDSRNQYKALITGLVSKCSVYCHADEDMEKSREILRVVSDFLKRFDAELMAAKESKNAVGFDDAERLALKLLAEVHEDGTIEKTPLAKELSEYYQLIMVDEFQDSNNRQDMIFRLLSRGGTAQSYGSNLFFVGDVKQAIYRFRLANPANFINALDSSAPYSEGTDRNSYIRLNRNFRSSKEVIDFSNYIFSCIMTRYCGDIDYNEEEYLYQGAKFCPAERKPVVILFDKSDKETENPEAKCVAAKIAQMLRDGVPVSTNGGEGSRPCEMKDFCILMRGNKNIPVYAKELEKLGINTECNAEGGYLKARETSVLINLLKVTDNPLLDTPLMSVMLSPMFMFTPDEAAEVRLVDKKANIYTNICKGIGLNGNPPLFEGELLAKAQFLHSVITELRLYVSACTLQELIRKIYDSTDFMSVMQLYGDAGKKKANLRMMLEYAGNYEKNSDGGLSGFIRYIDRIMDSGGDFEMAGEPHGSQNAVAIKSMHKSKGLEFPFVFIVGTWTRFNKIDSTKPFQFSYDMGLGFKLQNPEKYERWSSLPFELINIQGRLDDMSEEMRLLYVALTRAKERLFITMNCDESAEKKAVSLAKTIYEQQGITPAVAASANSMADWLMMCLISHSKSARLREIFGICESFRYDNDFEIEYEMCEPPGETEEEIKEVSAVRQQPDPQMMKELEDMFAFDYDKSVLSFLSPVTQGGNDDISQVNLSAKISVSDIAKDDSDFEPPLKRPEFAGESKLTPAEKGTALHRFLQFADFGELENDITSEKTRLYNTGYLTLKQKEAIREEDVKAFLDSGIYKRVKECVKVHREKKFLAAIDDLELEGRVGEEYKGTMGMINGIIDMVLEFEDYLVLVDYKTDRVTDINELAQRYSGQLQLYRKALEKTETKPVKETLIYSFYKRAEISVCK